MSIEEQVEFQKCLKDLKTSEDILTRAKHILRAYSNKD